MKNVDFIRLRATFSALGNFRSFSKEKMQKNTEKILKKCTESLIKK